MTISIRILCLALLAFSLLLSQTGPGAQGGAQTSTSRAKTAGRSTPTQQEIANAKAQGLVWVNLSTHVYHKEGPNYGTTKRGKFMTEDDAKKAGYRAAQETGPSKKHATSAASK